MSMSRWATNWIICRSRSASGVFSARSASAIVGLVIVVPPVGLVFANSTLPKPTVTPRKGRAIAGGARKPAPGYALRGFPSAIDLHHLQGHELLPCRGSAESRDAFGPIAKICRGDGITDTRYELSPVENTWNEQSLTNHHGGR